MSQVTLVSFRILHTPECTVEAWYLCGESGQSHLWIKIQHIPEQREQHRLREERAALFFLVFPTLKPHRRVGEVAQRLRALYAHLEDPGSTPSTHMVAHKPL